MFVTLDVSHDEIGPYFRSQSWSFLSAYRSSSQHPGEPHLDPQNGFFAHFGQQYDFSTVHSFNAFLKSSSLFIGTNDALDASSGEDAAGEPHA